MIALPLLVVLAAPVAGTGVYPAVVVDKVTLAYRADSRGDISQCRVVVSSGSKRRDDRACDRLRNSGLPRAVAAAEPIGAGWPVATPADYPERSITRGESGTVGVLFEVDEAGKVIGCGIIYSSGHALFDQ